MPHIYRKALMICKRIGRKFILYKNVNLTNLSSVKYAAKEMVG